MLEDSLQETFVEATSDNIVFKVHDMARLAYGRSRRTPRCAMEKILLVHGVVGIQ